MSRHHELTPLQQPDYFSHQTLELTFRLLRYQYPDLAFAIKRALDEVVFAPAEVLFGVTDEVHLLTDLIKSLNATYIIKIVAALNDTARVALQQKDLPPEHLKILRTLIEDWAKLAEWILQHTTSERTAYLTN